MCVGFLNLYCWSFALLVTMWVHWRGFRAMSIHHIWSCILAKYQWEVADSKPKLNANMSYQLSRWLIFSVSCEARIWNTYCDKIEICKLVITRMLPQQFEPSKVLKYSGNFLCFDFISAGSWVGLYGSKQQFVNNMNIGVCVCLKSLILTWYTAAVHLLVKTCSEQKAHASSLIGRHLGRGHSGQRGVYS